MLLQGKQMITKGNDYSNWKHTMVATNETNANKALSKSFCGCWFYRMPKNDPMINEIFVTICLFMVFLDTNFIYLDRFRAL